MVWVQIGCSEELGRVGCGGPHLAVLTPGQHSILTATNNA